MAKFTNPKDRVTVDDLNEGAENPDEEPVSRVTPIARAVEAPQTVTLTTEQFQQLLAAATSGGAGGPGLAEAITQGMKEAKEPIPENKTTERVSELNPLGDQKFPRAGLLKCKVFWGAIDDTPERAVHGAYEIADEDASIWELLALNMLEPCEKVIKRLDRAAMPVKVVARYNASTNALERLTIGFPMAVVGKGADKGLKNMIPDLAEVSYQLTGHDFRQDSLPYPACADYLREAMRLHRAKQFVCPAREVAA
jgi:hypothetical protein